ncbi:MAG: hypothetical protein M3R29_04850 [Verrucomicrobiota bacterium]|nr:hypothetical protein [Verrucomicrobiota bacterium]
MKDRQFHSTNGAKLWIVLGRPVRLPSALIAVQVLGDQFPGGCHLLRDESQWWERAQWQPYARYFADVHAFSRVKTCRGLVDLPRLYRESAERKRAVAALPVNPDTDVLLGLASVLGLGNAAASAHPNVYKILCISKSGYEGLMRHPDRMRFRFTTSGWLQNRVVEPLAGLERTLHFKPRLNPGGDGVRLLRLQRNPDDVYDTIVLMSNSGRESPTQVNERVITARFPSMKELRGFSPAESASNGQDRHRRVIFFGTPFLLIHNLSPEVYVEYLDRCLEFLRRNYAANCDLIYRPHPIETNEAERLNLKGFRIEDDREAAELYFLRHFAQIEAVYSVSSTVSRTAMNNGFNAYSLWRCFPFPETSAKFFEKIMGDVPPEFDIRDLTQLPIAYQASRKPDPDTRSFGEALKIAVETRETMSV